MIRLERIENYIVFTDLITGIVEDYPADDIYFRNEVADTFAFNHKFNHSLIRTDLWTNLVDSDNLAWTDKETLKIWLRANTGANEHLTDGAVDVILQDPTTPILVVPFSNITNETTITSVFSRGIMILL